jgi:citrate synthase
MLLQDGGVKIWRPRQVYVGSGARNYVEIGDRVNVAVAPRDSPSVVSHLQSKRVLLGRETARESKL